MDKTKILLPPLNYNLTPIFLLRYENLVHLNIYKKKGGKHQVKNQFEKLVFRRTNESASRNFESRDIEMFSTLFHSSL